MGFLKKFWRKKEPPKVPEKAKTEKTPLEILCTESPAVYEALERTMLLDPRKLNLSLEQAIANAKEVEKSGDTKKAFSAWNRAGQLSIFEGDVRKVKMCFAKCVELDPTFKPKIIEPGITEKAVKVEQEYYRKHLSAEEKKEAPKLTK